MTNENDECILCALRMKALLHRGWGGGGGVPVTTASFRDGWKIKVMAKK